MLYEKFLCAAYWMFFHYSYCYSCAANGDQNCAGRIRVYEPRSGCILLALAAAREHYKM